VELPSAKMTKWARKEREDWSSEDDIPLMELKKRIRNKKFEPNIENKLTWTCQKMKSPLTVNEI
jgi:hypothetical protein